ncbi:hypothetical protein [Herminiimonas arsenitoxidans]|uniref:hypothetical protein n=1 Tax=Herminiimonas arsenitoxidans TaxID=1809410 RepID=UPI0009708C85|nr:hypothetical protein [Herminiimonas arsenitoxidans]
MKLSFYPICYAVALLMTVVLPPLGYMIGTASSMSSGVFLLACLYILGYIFYTIRARGHEFQPVLITRSLIYFVGILAITLFVHSVVSLSIRSDLNSARLLKSLLFSFVFCLGVWAFVKLSFRVLDSHFDFAVKFVFYSLVIASLFALSGFSPFSPKAIKPVFFFSEPSHFALSFLPFFLYLVVTANATYKIILIALGYAIAFSLENLVLVAGVSIVAAFVSSFKQWLYLIPVGLLALMIAPIDHYYYVDRLILSPDSQNRSAMVFLSGWERAYLNLLNTNGLGVGFQQFGIIGERGELMEAIKKLNGADLNLLDGGAVAPKLIGEFGVVGIALISLYIGYSIKCARVLFAVCKKTTANYSPKKIFLFACFLMYGIDLFLRGVGYFSSSSFLFFAAVLLILTETPCDGKQLVSLLNPESRSVAQ